MHWSITPNLRSAWLVKLHFFALRGTQYPSLSTSLLLLHHFLASRGTKYLSLSRNLPLLHHLQRLQADPTSPNIDQDSVQVMDTCDPSSLVQLLENAASDPRDCAISVYAPGNVSKVAKRLTYRELLRIASTNAPILQQIPGVSRDTIFLLHFDNHLDGFEWLWSVIVAGYVPAVSTPLTNDLDQRRKHLRHLQHLFNDPLIITRTHLVSDFAGLEAELNIRTNESLESLK